MAFLETDSMPSRQRFFVCYGKAPRKAPAVWLRLILFAALMLFGPLRFSLSSL